MSRLLGDRCRCTLMSLALLLPLSWSIAQAVPAATPSTPSPTIPGDYLIGVEDLLHISVYGEAGLNMSVVVRPDGKISFPLVNDLKVEGKTAAQIRAEIREALLKSFRDPDVTVIVSEINSFRVYFLGAVNAQGALSFKRPIRLLQGLAAAGGLTPFAKREIVIRREINGLEQTIRIDYRALLAGDRGAENPFLRPGDTVLVE